MPRVVEDPSDHFDTLFAGFSRCSDVSVQDLQLHFAGEFLPLLEDGQLVRPDGRACVVEELRCQSPGHQSREGDDGSMLLLDLSFERGEFVSRVSEADRPLGSGDTRQSNLSLGCVGTSKVEGLATVANPLARAWVVGGEPAPLAVTP